VGSTIVWKAAGKNKVNIGENHTLELILEAYKSLRYIQRSYTPLQNFHQLMKVQALCSMQHRQGQPKTRGWHQGVSSKPPKGITVLQEIRLAAVRENKRMAGQAVDHP